MEYTPDFIETLLANQVFVFGSNVLGYHTGGASRVARKKFGAIWGQAEGIQGQSYAIPVDFGGHAKLEDIKPYIDRFIEFAKEHQDKHFLVTRIGCGTAGFKDEDMGPLFKEALDMGNISLPKGFVAAINHEEPDYQLDRFILAQNASYNGYKDALKEIEGGLKRGHWIWYIFPQIKGLGFSYNSEYYGISGEKEAQAYLNHPLLGKRLREITTALLELDKTNIYNIVGRPDDVKVQSCMTLFDLVAPNDIFQQVLDKYYDGIRCKKTMSRLRPQRTSIEIQMPKPALKLIPITISDDNRIIIGEKEMILEPINKTVYLFFLSHPEGINFKDLPDYRDELVKIYLTVKPNSQTSRVEKSIEDLVSPLSNSINEKCARINSILRSMLGKELAESYIIDGQRGSIKKVALPLEMITWK